MNVIISGLTCSGKTTLSNEINNASILREDDYMKDRINMPHNRRYYLMDIEEAYNIDEYVSDVNKILEDGYVYYPQYDVSRNTRVHKNNLLQKSNINVFEGLHTIKALKDLRDSIKVYMDTDINTCLERRVRRDTNSYNMDEKGIREYFNEVVLPTYRQYMEYQKDIADIVIRGEMDKECLKMKLQKYY